MRLSVVVPAYNEEEAIEPLLKRLARARDSFSKAGAAECEVIVVDDGSTDRTAERARGVDGVRVISHPRNRGYGAAIKTGFSEATGQWLGFLDADGTCDPESLGSLLSFARERDVDVALGSRIHEGSQMPAVRMIGNIFFRWVVRFLGGGDMTDLASGIRVVRRESLDRLYPLPDGLHFTPAMSVRAILDPSLKIAEMPVPYAERVGDSKLSVVIDGLRFLRVIVETALTYRPLRFFSWAAALLAICGATLLAVPLGGPASPAAFYFSEGHIADWMVFRLILVAVLASSASLFFSIGIVAQSLVGIINRDTQWPLPWVRFFPGMGFLSLAAAGLINRRPLASYWATGGIPNEFWPFPVAGALFAIVGLGLFGLWVVGVIARMLWEREQARR